MRPWHSAPQHGNTHTVSRPSRTVVLAVSACSAGPPAVPGLRVIVGADCCLPDGLSMAKARPDPEQAGRQDGDAERADRQQRPAQRHPRRPYLLTAARA
jgi:hypothetical protein